MTENEMLKPMDTHGRPQCDDTQFVIELFQAKGILKTCNIKKILGCQQSTDNRIRYLKNKGYIKSVKRGIWELTKVKK